MRLTQKIAKEYVRILGGKLIRKIEFDEYIVKFGTNEYFATDLDDVIGTARAMAGTHPAFKQAQLYLYTTTGGRMANCKRCLGSGVVWPTPAGSIQCPDCIGYGIASGKSVTI